MAKTKDEFASGKRSPESVSLLETMFRLSIYKPTQGRLVRSLTGGALGIIVGYGSYLLARTFETNQAFETWLYFLALAAPLGWFCYRIVNYPRFAEFLIATEVEMNKVSWASREDLRRATIVVLVTVVIIATYLTIFDVVWGIVLKAIGVLQIS